MANFACKVVTFVAANYEWILDSEASDRMTCQKKFLSHERKLFFYSNITIHDGYSVTANTCGDVARNSSITLNHVLHVPMFACNLISISKLTQSLNCVAHFFPTFCVLQDLAMRKMIGMDKRKNSLYYFQRQALF